MTAATLILDAYSGARGWSQGLRELGLDDVGIEHDPSACATSTAAGHRTIRADVATFPLDHLAGRVWGLIMSPPCQAFSTAGNGEGRTAIDDLDDAIRAGDWTWSHDDDRVRHVLEVGRWAETLRPTWIACEQVPPVLPLWRTYAERWRAQYGWSTWAGVLCSADWGVPQTRRRAFLIARSDGHAALPPEPTHCDGGAVTLTGELAPWVSMADALGWDDVTVYHQRGAGMAERHGERPGRPADQPEPPITAGANRRLVLDRRQNSRGGHLGEPGCRPVPIDEPSPSLDSQVGGKWVLRSRRDSPTWVEEHGARHDRSHAEPAPTITGEAHRWVHERPATTVAGDPRLSGAGRNDPDVPGSQYGPDAIRLTVRDALILQSFSPDYPVQGTKTKQFEQIGNAVPPRLAAHVIAAVTGHTIIREAT